MELKEWAGCQLGTRVVQYREEDAILYALAVGARADDLPLVFERDLKVLPTFALPLALWVADAASEAGAFVPEEALHGAQSLAMHRALPRSAEFEVYGRIQAVRDTGRSAILDIEAECEYFSAIYSIILPGKGGFSSVDTSTVEVRRAVSDSARGPVLTPSLQVRVPPTQAALYRLTGDRHLIHIDPGAARAAGFAGPILHGLCTLGTVARALAVPLASEPWELSAITARFAAPVYPGSALDIAIAAPESASLEKQCVPYAVSVGGAGVLTEGRVSY
ncbi:MaoC/PaaZ C-terminal domain-containing protein [Rhodococcus sp. C26F]